MSPQMKALILTFQVIGGIGLLVVGVLAVVALVERYPWVGLVIGFLFVFAIIYLFSLVAVLA